MKTCTICKKEFPNWIKVDGKNKNLQRRKYCLECSPFGQHNTIRLEEGSQGDCLKCGNKLKGKQTMYCSKKCKFSMSVDSYKFQKKRFVHLSD
jgi:hypothetical protein